MQRRHAEKLVTCLIITEQSNGTVRDLTCSPSRLQQLTSCCPSQAHTQYWNPPPGVRAMASSSPSPFSSSPSFSSLFPSSSSFSPSFSSFPPLPKGCSPHSLVSQGLLALILDYSNQAQLHNLQGSCKIKM